MTMRRSTFRKSCEGAWPGGLGCAPRNPGASPPFPRAGPRLSPRGRGPWQGHLLTACRRRNALGGSHRRTRYLRWRQMDRETQRQKEMAEEWGVEGSGVGGTETGREPEQRQEQKADPGQG